jgi:hypothetical protein
MFSSLIQLTYQKYNGIIQFLFQNVKLIAVKQIWILMTKISVHLRKRRM